MSVKNWVRSTLFLVLFMGTVWVSGCSRGQPRERPPTVIIPDMEFQKKLKAQNYTDLFEDGRTMRTPPAGTVARGTLKEDTIYFEAKLDGELVAYSPEPITATLLRRGQERFDIFCAPCHDRGGSGRGIVVGYGLVPPPSYHEQRIRDVTDGHLFDVISNGVRTMPGYRAQIPTEDRWAIVSYIRALQRSRNATLADVPEDVREELR